MRKPLSSRLFVIAGSMLLTLLLLEFGMRVYLVHFASAQYFIQHASLNQFIDRHGDDFTVFGQFEPHRYLGYMPRRNYELVNNRHNSLGFRGEKIEQNKPAGVFRIVCIGGSTTYSTVSGNYKHSYPYMLENFLHDRGYENVEVINAGVHGYTSLESYINLQTRILPLQPDMIIIYHGINDVHQRFMHPPEEFFADYSGSRQIRLNPVKMPSILEYSTLLRTVGGKIGVFESHASLDWQLIHRPATWYADEFYEQKQNGTYPDGIFETVPADEMLATNGTQYFDNNMRSMVATAKLQSITPLIVSFATSAEFSETEFPAVASAEAQFALAQHNDVLAQIAADEETLFFDLEAVMPDDMEYYTDGQHFTMMGNRFRVRRIGNYIIQSGVLDP